MYLFLIHLILKLNLIFFAKNMTSLLLVTCSLTLIITLNTQATVAAMTKSGFLPKYYKKFPDIPDKFPEIPVGTVL